jgi:hypothetical protein
MANLESSQKSFRHMPRLQDLCNEISRLRRDPQMKGYPQVFIYSVINSKRRYLQTKEETRLGSVYIPYMKGLSQKLQYRVNRYSIRLIFRKERTLRTPRMKSRPKRDTQHTAKPTSSISSACGRSCSGETCKSLASRLLEYRHSLKECLVEQSKLARRAYGEVRRVS